MQNHNDHPVFTLVICACSAEELKAKVLEAAGQYGAVTTPSPVAPKVAVATEAPAPAAKEAPKSKAAAKKGAAKKEEQDPFADEAAPEAEAEPTEADFDPFADEEAPKEITFDDVKAAIQKVCDTHPKKTEAAKDILKALKVARVKEITAEQYGTAVELCNKALK